MDGLSGEQEVETVSSRNYYVKGSESCSSTIHGCPMGGANKGESTTEEWVSYPPLTPLNGCKLWWNW